MIDGLTEIGSDDSIRIMARVEVIETTAGEVAAELARRGISSDERVTVTIDPAQELVPGRREARARVVASGLSDDDIDRLIKKAQSDVEPHQE